MKINKIALRLIIYFVVSLSLLSLMISGIFGLMFGQYTTGLHKSQLTIRAQNIAQSLSELLDTGAASSQHPRQMQGGLGSYLRFIDDIAMSDVWIIDKEYQIITRGQGKRHVNYEDFPKEAEDLISEIFTGEIVVSESFSSLLNETSMTVGVPITDSNENIMGAVLLHSSISGLGEARKSQLKIMAISVFFALLICIPIAVLLSLRFIKPINIMKQTSMGLADGNYSIKNNINQKDEIGELANTIDTLSDRLNKAESARQEQENQRRIFLSNISHELRTPVTVLRGSLEALCDGIINDPKQIEEYHRQMLKDSMHLQRLVNDLLELSTLQNTDFSLDMKIINMQELLADVARTMRRISEQKNITIELKKVSENHQVHGDYGRLRQMLIVAVDNAIKFSDENKTVYILESYSNLSATENKLYTVSIIDEGSGITQEDMPYLFDRFHKEKSSANVQGTGLGLAIAKEIADRHNIKIKIDSRPGKTEVSFIYMELRIPLL